MTDDKNKGIKEIRQEFLKQAGLGLANPKIELSNHIAGQNILNFMCTVPTDSTEGKELRDTWESMRHDTMEAVKVANEKNRTRYLEQGDFAIHGIPDLESKMLRHMYDVCWDVALRFELV